MKRDMELCQQILEAIETRTDSDPATETVVIAGRDPNEIGFHVGLLIDAGFVVGERIHGKGWQVRKLTWRGCDYLDQLRSGTTVKV